MPKYSGLIELKGTFGNLTFYKRKGVNCVRRPGGFSKERLRSDPKLRRVVEHHGEFGAQSMASKSVRTALASIRNFYDGTFHNRLMRIAARITGLTEGVHGKRPVAFSRIKPILDNVQLQAKRSLESSLPAPGMIKSTPTATRNSTKLTLDFNIPVAVIAPEGATHFRLVHALGVVSDIEYEPALDGFIPVAHQVDGLNSTSHSEYISLKEQQASIIFEDTLKADVIPDNATVLEVLGIDFYEFVARHYLPMEQGRAAKIVGAF
jgi:hypothetical protein